MHVCTYTIYYITTIHTYILWLNGIFSPHYKCSSKTRYPTRVRPIYNYYLLHLTTPISFDHVLHSRASAAVYATQS